MSEMEQVGKNIKKFMDLVREALPTAEQVADNINEFARQLREFENEEDNSDTGNADTRWVCRHDPRTEDRSLGGRWRPSSRCRSI